jgi:hypothetical protein
LSASGRDHQKDESNRADPAAGGSEGKESKNRIVLMLLRR